MNIHLLRPMFTIQGYMWLKVKNILSCFWWRLNGKKGVTNTMFFTYLPVSISSLVKLLAINTLFLLFSLILLWKSSHRFHDTRSCMFCLVSCTWSWILFCGIKIASHRFLAKNIFAMLGKDDQEKGTDLWEKRKTCLVFSPSPFWKPFMVIPSPRSLQPCFHGLLSKPRKRPWEGGCVVLIFHLQDGGNATKPVGLSPCILPCKCKSGPMPPS